MIRSPFILHEQHKNSLADVLTVTKKEYGWENMLNRPSKEVP